jgi:hypothetical protein
MDISKYAGVGQETIVQQESMPLIKILQDMSPEVNPRKDGYIEGAQAGDLLFNKDKSLLGNSVNIIPLASKPVYVEWKPRDQGGGMVATHPLTITADPRYKKVEYTETLGDNDLIYTTYWCVLMQVGDEWEKALIAMTKTQLKVSRKLSGEIAKFRYDGQADVQPPTFARVYELSTVLEKNKADQEFFNFDVKPVQVIEDEALLDSAFASYNTAISELPAPDAQPALADGGEEDPY